MKKRFERLVDENGGRLLQFARLLLSQTPDAEDVVQDCLIKLWKHLGRLDPGAERAWLFTCARNACLDRLRAQQRRQRFENSLGFGGGGNPGDALSSSVYRSSSSSSQEPGETLEQAERALLLGRLVGELKEPARSLLILRDIQGQDVSIVATILGLSTGQVKVYTHRARRALRRKLEEVDHA
ncbi:MAG: sigma-70 family RNA polymerase sigma factor [Pseudomonadota bacterium]